MHTLIDGKAVCVTARSGRKGGDRVNGRDEKGGQTDRRMASEEVGARQGVGASRRLVNINTARMRELNVLWYHVVVMHVVMW